MRASEANAGAASVETAVQSAVQAATAHLSFFLGEGEYALPLDRVEEIAGCDSITHVPGVPPFIRGVMNLRGRILPVIDLGVKFGEREAKIVGTTCVMVVAMEVGDERVTLGLLAERIDELIDLRPGDIQPPPSFGVRVALEFLIGMAERHGAFVLVLDIDRILSRLDAEMAASVAERSDAGGEESAE